MLRNLATVAAAALFAIAQPVVASDLLVAPTRIVLDGNSGGEVMVSNTGDKTTTYRISLVLRRMDATGQINPLDEALATPSDAAALDIINYAPRKITLAPQQPQTVRIGVRAPPSLAPGEYRAHLLFRAVPDAATIDAPAPDAPKPGQPQGMSIALTPIYGIAIPVIVRIGAVEGKAVLTNAHMTPVADGARVTVTLQRSGNRSVYGTLDVLAQGSNTPISTVKGLAAYTEVASRDVSVTIARDKLPAGPLVVRFTETDPAGAGAVVEAKVARGA